MGGVTATLRCTTRHRRRRSTRLLSSIGWTSDQLARCLYRSLRDRLLTLPDATRVYPAHGAGSACGKNMSTAVVSTIGEQRAANYALRPMSEDAFVAAVTEGQPVAPLYFAFAADANRRSRDLLDDTDAPMLLDVAGWNGAPARGAIIIDGRAPEVFASGHFRGSVNVPLDGRFAEYAGDIARPASDRHRDRAGTRTEAKVRLARIGFDRVRGAIVDIERALTEHPELAATARRLPAVELASLTGDDSSPQINRRRNLSEHDAG